MKNFKILMTVYYGKLQDVYAADISAAHREDAVRKANDWVTLTMADSSTYTGFSLTFLSDFTHVTIK